MRILDFDDGFTSNSNPTEDSAAYPNSPATTTDNAVVRFNGTDGKNIQNSGVIIDDSNNISTPGDITTEGNLEVQGDTQLDSSLNGVVKAVAGAISANPITNSDIDSSAAIARSKIATGSASQVLINDGSGNLSSEATLAKSRGGSGQDNSSLSFPASGTLATTAGSETLTNKTIDGDDNTVQDLPLTAIKTNVSDASKFIVRDASGIPVSNTKAVPTGTVVGTSDTQALTNKDIDGGTASNSSRLTVPKASKSTLDGLTRKQATIVYASDLDKLYVDTGSTLKQVGSAGGGSKNYLGNINGTDNGGDFETGSVGSWVLGNASLTSALPTGSPTFGSGASGNLTGSVVSSGQLAGSYSYSYASSAATTAGNFLASPAFTIDIADQAKVMTVKFSYKAVTNPSNANWSGTSSNSFGVAVWDVTNSAWIIPAGCFGMTQSSGVGICTGTFQTSANSTSYRLVVYNANATSGSATVYFDDFFLGPQTAPLGAVITDLIPYTPTFTGFGTVTAVNILSRRVGSNLEVQGSFTTGTTIASTASMTLGFNGSNANVTTDSRITSLRIVGNAIVNVAGNTVDFAGRTILANGSVGSVNFGAHASTINPNAAANGNVISPSTTIVNFYFSVPIQGWSSNVQMSNDTDTRITSFVGTQSSQAVTANVTNIAFTATKDSNAAWNGTQYVVPVSGDYVVAGSLIVNAAGVTGIVYLNGSAALSGTAFLSTTSGSGTASAGSVLVPNCKAGDLLSLRINSSQTVSTSSISIFRLSGPSVIAATETVAARYYGLNGVTSTTTSGVVKFYTKGFDTHNAYSNSTGLFTVPVSGIYRVTTCFNNSSAANAGAYLYLGKNGNTELARLGTSVLLNGTNNGCALIDAKAGDTLGIYSSINTLTLADGQAYAYVNYERVGN